MNVISGSVGIVVGAAILRRIVKQEPYKVVICMLGLLITASAFQLESSLETLYFLRHVEKGKLLPMTHFSNYVVSQLGGLLLLLCDLLMAAMYLDTAAKLFTKKLPNAIAYSFAIFAAVIFCVSLITITVLLVKLRT